MHSTRATRPIIAITDPLEDEGELLVWGFIAGGFDPKVIDSGTPQQMIEAVSRLRPDVIVHRTSPKNPGTALVRALHQSPETAAVPVLILTTDPRDEVQDAARAAGAEQVLLLPLEPSRICKAVERLILERHST